MKSMKAAVGFALVMAAGAGQAGLLSTGPCPLGMFLTMRYPSMVPSCVGAQIPGVGGAAGAAGEALQGAAGSALQGLVGASSGSPAGGANANGAALASQAADWGGSNNFGSVSGFNGIVVKVISCDELSGMRPGMVNPQNVALGYEDLVAQNLLGEGEVQNGWWAQKLTYQTYPTGLPASGYGGAVVQYASLKTADGGSMNQTAKIVSTGSCERKVVPYAGSAGVGANASSGGL